MTQCLRLLCFISLSMMVFLDIYISFNAEWKRDLSIAGTNTPQDTMQYYRTLWNNCNMPPTTRKVTCDFYFSRIGGGTATAQDVTWRAIMALSIVLLIASAACSLLSLDCVLMTDRKNVMALSSGIIAVSAGALIGLVAVWFTVKYLSIRAQAPPNLSIASQDIRLDRYKPTPGAGLIFAYIVAITAMLIGGLMICYSSSYYSSQSMLDDYDEHGMRRPSMPISMMSGYQSGRPTVLRKVSDGLTNEYGSKHSIIEHEIAAATGHPVHQVPQYGPNDFI